jgi:hypothetical protein
MLDSYIYLQNPAWVFRGNVVSHMGHDTQQALKSVHGYELSTIGREQDDDTHLDSMHAGVSVELTR